MGKRKVLTVTLDDCLVQVFRAGGHGGQNQNKVSSGVRVIHEPSGARGEARDSRDQPRNKLSAFKRMVATPAFQAWARTEATTLPGDILAEVHVGGQWVTML